MRFKSKLLQLSSAGALTLAAVGTAQAVPTLTLFESVSNTTIVITDNGVGDSTPDTGVIGFERGIGAFNVTVITGKTKPNLGTASAPHMDLTFIANATGVGNLSILFSDDGFIFAGGLVDTFRVTVGSNSTVSDTVLKNGTALITQGPFPTGALTATSSAAVTLLQQDVLSLRVNIVTTGAGLSEGDKDVNSVPGNGSSAPDNGLTVSLLGGAMVGLIALRRKMRSV